MIQAKFKPEKLSKINNQQCVLFRFYKYNLYCIMGYWSTAKKID